MSGALVVGAGCFGSGWLGGGARAFLPLGDGIGFDTAKPLGVVLLFRMSGASCCSVVWDVADLDCLKPRMPGFMC